MSKSSKKSNSKSSKNASLTIEEKYKKMKDQHEHILKKPASYIGSTKEESIVLWVYNDKASSNAAQIVPREISYVPGLYKIFDEILVNARDHRITTLEEKKETCTIIKVNIDKETGQITVWNNGAGIPVVVHKEFNVLLPSMLFGELLTSSNYNDDQKRRVGGTNGLGAKLTNIYSTEFILETLDADTNQKFYQRFADNMYTKDKAKVTSGKGKKPYTKIAFTPDYKRFGLKGLTNDIIALFKKRVYDIAMNSGAKVYYNDELISINSFAKYVDLYFPEGSEHKKVMDISDDNWKIAVVYDPTDKLEHQQISFVNGICTSRGGNHYDYISNQIVNKLKDSVTKKLKGANIKPSQIKENLIFFIDSIIVNPDFDTQTKERLTTKVADFGSSYKAPEKFLKAIAKTGVVESIVANINAKAEANVIKTGKTKGTLRLEKLYEAHHAQRKKGDCTLILTEGDSAKTFAMSGLNVVGRDLYGVFPLKGKLLNVRDASPTKIMENDEIQAIIKIIGLEPRKVYSSTAGLRYGKIMVLADQDVDGSHIKGLVMNFIHHFWPSLVKEMEFICSFNTPILKATKGTGKNRQAIAFNNIQSFEEWKKENNDGRGWTIKYYKGLGTSTSKEAQECFEDLDDKLITYYWETKREKESQKSDSKKSKNSEKSDSKKSDSKKSDSKKSDSKTSHEKSEFIDQETDITTEEYKPKAKDISEDALTLAFAKKRENDRKAWLNSYDPENYIDNTERKISYYDFIHRELIAFSVYDTARSVPNIMDGFKPGQRKVYYGCVKKNIYKNEIKVAQLSGYIAEHSHYHHGEISLQETIIKMAQNYVGSNNINLLLPNGQFGSRLQGGKDAASARYIYTQLNDLGKKIFIEDDFDILKQQKEDNDEIEPVYYAPIVPMILINGTEGIGTGYSSTIEPCNPRDVFDNLKRIIGGDKPRAMTPWYRHFTGTIEKIEKNKFISRAKYDVIGNDTIHITDLPIGVWTDNYKAFLDNLLEAGATQKAQDKKEKKAAKATKGKKSGSKKAGKNKYLAKKSKKSNTAKVAKKNTIGADIKTYSEDCTDVRVSFTIVFNPGKLQHHIKKGTLEKGLKLVTPLNITNMHLFNENGKIKKYDSYGAILNNFAKVRLDLYQKRKDYLLDKWRHEMDMLNWKLKFVEGVISDEIIVFKKKSSEIIAQLEDKNFPKFIQGEKKTPSYDYLTSMTILKFSKDEVEKLRKQIEAKQEEIATLEGKTPSQLWEQELDDLIEAYDKWEAEVDAAYEADLSKKKGVKNKTRKSKNKSKTVEVDE